MAQQRYRLRLMETFRSVFYTPIYVAVAEGFLERAGLVRNRKPYEKVVHLKFAEAV